MCQQAVSTRNSEGGRVGDGHHDRGRDANVKPDEGSRLGVEIFPSACTPGYVRVRASGVALHDVLERVKSAADLVVVLFSREDAFQNAAALQKTCFRAKPHTGMQPPNARSVFFVTDDGFVDSSCRPHDRGVRHNEYQHTGHARGGDPLGDPVRAEAGQGRQQCTWWWARGRPSAPARVARARCGTLATGFHSSSENALVVERAGRWIYPKGRTGTGAEDEDENERVGVATPAPYAPQATPNGTLATAEAATNPLPGSLRDLGDHPARSCGSATS